MKSFSQYTQYQESFVENAIAEATQRLLAEANLKTTDIGKRNNLQFFADKIWEKEPHEMVSGPGTIISKVKIGTTEYKAITKTHKQKFIDAFNNERDSKGFKLELFDKNNKSIPWSSMAKTADYGGVTGSKGPTGAQWESLITYHVNLKKGSPNNDTKAKDVALDPKFAGYQKAAEAIAQNFIGSDIQIKTLMTQHGASLGKGTLSDLWTNKEKKRTVAGATNTTPKTDMYTDNFNISLKKRGGSQVASGTKEETIATFYAALEYASVDPKTKKLVHKVIKSIEGGFNDVALNYGTKKLKSIAKGTQKANLDSDQKKELTTFTQTDEFHKELNIKLKDELNIEENQEFINWFVFEAMSGFKKFDNSSNGRQSVASVCTTFNAENPYEISSIKLTKDGKSGSLKKVDGIPTLSSELKSKAKEVKIYAAWKSSGIRPYSTLRVSGDNHEPDYVPLLDCTLDSIIRDVLSNDEMANQVHRTLNEDLVMLDEFAVLRKVWNKVKEVGKNALNWMKGFFAKVMKKVKVVFEKIKKMGKNIFHATFQFLGITITKAKATVPKDIQGFVYGMAD